MIYDISRELLSAPVYPGDPAPTRTILQSTALGDVCNLSALSMCAHSGTHIDAPRHFLEEGATVDRMPLDIGCGACQVVQADGVITGEAAERILQQVTAKRLLFKGAVTLDLSAAYVLADAALNLVGVEAQSVAAAHNCEAVHRCLLGRGVWLLEGLDLSAVEPGGYTLYALPLKIAESDGAPVRAILVGDTPLEVDAALFRHRPRRV